MAVASDQSQPGFAAELNSSRKDRYGSGVLRFFRREPAGALAALVVLVIGSACVFAPVVALYKPNLFDYNALLQSPAPGHVMGTDQFGRDILSRLLYGGRVSAIIATSGVGIATVVGTILGMAAGYWRGAFDVVIQRVTDAIMAFPLLIFALLLVALLGPSVANVSAAIAITQIPRFTKVVRSLTLALREETYVHAAAATGAGSFRVLRYHILPNLAAPLIVMATISLASAILVEASISFLGLGPPPPTASWGEMLSSDARAYFDRAPWMAIFPGIAMTVLVLCINITGDALRDFLDPRLRNLR